MNKIESFKINHNKLKEGLYISRIDEDITTYDMRTRIPNSDNFMDTETMHTVEHMLATYLRNSEIKDKIIYFGPMGCATGFYILIRNTNHEQFIEILKDCLLKTINHTGEVFGNSKIECGNYKTLNLEKAKKECKNYYNNIKNITINDLYYKE